MHKTRLEAFTDGVIAIIITIMVLELKVPHGPHILDLKPLLPELASYALSFVFVGIYWNNHHHLLQAAKHVSGGALWANLHLLFWLSLIPLMTAWVGHSSFAGWPVALYGAVQLLCGVAYTILVRTLANLHDSSSVLVAAIGNNVKGKISLVLYAAGTAIALWIPLLAYAVYIFVAALWLIPDRAIERALSSGDH